MQHTIIKAVNGNGGEKNMIMWNDEYLSTDDFVLVLGESYFGIESIDISTTPHVLIGGGSGSHENETGCVVRQAVKNGLIAEERYRAYMKLKAENAYNKNAVDYLAAKKRKFKQIAKLNKHFMDIMNGSYAQTHFPCKLWDAGEKGLTLSAFEWEKDRKTLIYGQVDYMYGEALYKPEMKEGNPIRLYSLDEITEIFCKLGLRICNSFADFSGKPSSDNDIQLMVYSIRE